MKIYIFAILMWLSHAHAQNLPAIFYCQQTSSICQSSVNSSTSFDCATSGDVSHGSNCTMFWRCGGDRFFGCECECPTGSYGSGVTGPLHFDQNSHLCLPPHFANCTPTPITAISATSTSLTTSATTSATTATTASTSATTTSSTFIPPSTAANMSQPAALKDPVCSCPEKSNTGLVVAIILAILIGLAGLIVAIIALQKAKAALGESAGARIRPRRSTKYNLNPRSNNFMNDHGPQRPPSATRMPFGSIPPSASEGTSNRILTPVKAHD